MFDVGTTVGDLRVEALTRTTGSGWVYAAVQSGLDRAVTMYVADAPADSEAGRRFLADVTRLAAIDDPNLLPVYEVRTVQGRIVAIGGATGVRLDKMLADAPLPPERAVAVVAQMVAAAEALEGAGVRGVLPDATTVFVSPDGAARFATVDALLEPAAAQRSVQRFGDLLNAASGGRVPRPRGDFTTPRELIEAARADLAQRGPRRWHVPVAIGAALAGTAAAVLLLWSDDTPQRASAKAPAARIAAVIDVGGPARSIGVGEGGIWVGRQDRQLVRIDPATNRVVGAPVRFAPPAPASDTNVTVRAGAGAVFAMDRSGIVVRIDPKTERVTGRARTGRPIAGATVAGSELWVLLGPPTRLLRLDAGTLRRLSPPIAAARLAFDVESSGSIAYLADAQGDLARVDTRTRRVDEFHPVGQAYKIALRDGVLWIPDASSETLVQVDAHRLKPRGEVVRDLDRVRTATSLGDSIWVTSTGSTDASTPATLRRIDAATGRLAGRPLALGAGVGWPQAGDGALWISSDRGVLKVLPTSPEPATVPNRPAPARSKTLLGGPLQRGTYAVHLGRTRFSVTTEDDGWIAVLDEASVGIARLTDSTTSMGVFVPAYVFDRRGGLVRPHSVREVLRTLRANPRLIVGRNRHTSVGGEPAIEVEIGLRGRPRSNVCGQPCLPVFDFGTGGFAVDHRSKGRIMLFRHRGRLLVVGLSAPLNGTYQAPMRLVDSIRLDS